MSQFTLRADVGAWPRFGDYAVVEQKRHGAPNEMFYHKVVATLHSNSWVDVPVQSPPSATIHDTSEQVAIVICCGVSESETYRVRVADLHKVEVAGTSGEAMSGWIKCSDMLPPIKQRVLAYRLGRKTNDGPFFAMTCGNEHRPWRYIDGDRCDITPTHWQPLPAPPTE